MTRFGWLVASCVMVAVLGIALLLWGFSRQSGTEETISRTPVVDYESLNLYASGTYGFSFSYPASASTTDAFTSANAIPWRSSGSATGTPIVQIILADAEARVGASDAREALTNCTQASPSERRSEPLSVSDITWEVFTSERLGTENTRRITSYRTVHEGRCIALEVFEPLEAGSGAAEQLSHIVRSFSFARPDTP